ncbi:MAG: ATPase [Clostridia bacterium]|nr:ATPase [Clostridia bacterium]
MPNNLLFDSVTFTMECPAPFNGSSVPRERTDVYSAYNTASAKKSTLHAPTLRAVLAYMKLFKATTDGDPTDNLGAIGTQNDKKFVGEYVSGRGEIQGVIYNRENESIMASVFDSATAPPTQYKHKAAGGTATGSAVFFTLMPIFLEDDEFKRNYDALYEQFCNGYTDWEAAEKAGFILCDNVYRRITYASGSGPAGVKVDFPVSGNVRTLTKLAIDKGTYSPNSVIMGSYRVIKAGLKPKGRKAKIDIKDFEGKYKMTERSFSGEESEMVPKLPDWYIIPEEVVTICEMAQKTTETNVPMRNFMLRGAAGSGKTEGAKAIAAGLGLPYKFITCSADNEIFDFIGQILPDIEGLEFASSKQAEYIPTNGEIDADPVGSYYNMTGNFVEDITAEQVKQIVADKISLKEEKKKDKKDFRYVYTPLIEAIKNGYLVELQEPTVISKPGVLVGLNSLLDNCKAITLPTGERIERHPDTVIVVTTNNDYEGCRDINQSVISRMNLIFNMETPNAKVMTERVLKITGCKDKSVVKQMAEVVEKIIKKCRESMITDGCCGMRELINWVQSYMVCDDVMTAAEYTVLSSVSSDEENRKEIEAECLSPVFGTL